MRPLSLSPLTVHPCSPIELIDAAVASGYQQVGLRILPVLSTDAEIMGDTQMQKAIKARIMGSDLTVLDIEVARVSPAADLDALDRALEFGASVGAQSLAVTSLDLSSYSPDDEAETVSKLHEFGEHAARFDMKIMLEFMLFRGIQTLTDATRIVTAADSPHVGVTLDALHFFRSGGTVQQISETDVSLIGCLQLCDGLAKAPEDLVHESRYGRYYPGLGELALRDLVASLPRSLPLAVEAPSLGHAHLTPKEKAAEAMRHARKLLDETGSN